MTQLVVNRHQSRSYSTTKKPKTDREISAIDGGDCAAWCLCMFLCDCQH